MLVLFRAVAVYILVVVDGTRESDDERIHILQSADRQQLATKSEPQEDPLEWAALHKCNVEGAGVSTNEVRLFTPELLVSDIDQQPSSGFQGVADNEEVLRRGVTTRLPNGACRIRGYAYLACRPPTDSTEQGVDVCSDLQSRNVFCFQNLDRQCRSLVAQAPPDFMMGPITGVAPVREGKWHVAHLGLGEGSLGTFITSRFHEADVDAVDLDPTMIHAAKHFFGHVEGPRYRIHHADAVAWLKKQPTSYFDAIHMGCTRMINGVLVDGNGFYTDSFFKLVRQKLNKGGRFSVMTEIAKDMGVETVAKLFRGAGFGHIVVGDGPRGTTTVGFTDEETPAFFDLSTSKVSNNWKPVRMFPDWTWRSLSANDGEHWTNSSLLSRVEQEARDLVG